jgi:hypothetical protein
LSEPYETETIFNHEPSGKRRTSEWLLGLASTKRKIKPAIRMPPIARNLTFISYRIKWLSNSITEERQFVLKILLGKVGLEAEKRFERVRLGSDPAKFCL